MNGILSHAVAARTAALLTSSFDVVTGAIWSLRAACRWRSPESIIGAHLLMVRFTFASDISRASGRWWFARSVARVCERVARTATSPQTVSPGLGETGARGTRFFFPGYRA
jgi:hypothetical protein